MKKYLLMFVVLLTVVSSGCAGSPSRPKNVGLDFLQQKGLRLIVNSEAAEDIQLPADFGAAKGGVNVGALLQQSNDLSKKNGLDFSQYMGRKVRLYTAAIDTGDPKANYDVVLVISDDRVVGYWVDQGMKDPNQGAPDFNVLVRSLMTR